MILRNKFRLIYFVECQKGKYASKFIREDERVYRALDVTEWGNRSCTVITIHLNSPNYHTPLDEVSCCCRLMSIVRVGVLLVQFYTVQRYNQLRLVYFQAALTRSSLISSAIFSSMVKKRGKVTRGGEGRVMMMLVREIYAQYFRHTTA
jgi:hypothetical protein